MTDSYQPIYDAVRSRIGNCDVGHVVERAAREAFDFGHSRDILVQEFCIAAAEMRAPHVLMRPEIFSDGKLWCALYGIDLQSGVAGFGETPALACEDFDKNWHGQTLGAKP